LHTSFVRTSFGQLFPRTRNIHVTRKKAAKTTFVQKKRKYKVDEINTLSRFHQTFFSTGKVAGAQHVAKNRRSMSPTMKTPN